MSLLAELDEIVAAAPVFIWPNKTHVSAKVKDLCILQSVNYPALKGEA